jgi:ABC-type glycerol-3-phosphate transport system substrate-binding protein
MNNLRGVRARPLSGCARRAVTLTSVSLAMLLLALVAGVTVARGTLDSSFTASKAQAKVTITVASWAAGGPGFWTKTAKLFETANPNIKVKFENVPYPAYYQKVGAYAAANSGPDVVMLEAGGQLTSRLAIVKPLNKLGFTAKYMSQFVASAQAGACSTADCKKRIFGVPQIMQAHPLYYNKRVFKAAGLDPNKPPKTWREFAADCAAIKKIGKTCWAFGGGDLSGLLADVYLPHETVSTTDFSPLQNKTLKWTDPKLLATFQIFKWMVDQGWFQDGAVSAKLDPDATGLYASDKAGFIQTILGGGLFDWRVQRQTMGDANYGAMALPAIESNYPVQGVSPGPLAGTLDVSAATVAIIPKWSKHADAAARYLRFLVSPQTQLRQLNEDGGFPSLRVLNASSLKLPAAFSQLQKLVSASKAPPITLRSPPAIYDALIAQSQLQLLGKATPEEAAKAVQEAQESR